MIQPASALTIVAFSVPLLIGQPIVVSTSFSDDEVRHIQPLVTYSNTPTTSASPSVGQAYFWTQKWQQQEDTADKELREGNFSEFETAEEAIAWLFDGEA